MKQTLTGFFKIAMPVMTVFLVAAGCVAQNQPAPPNVVDNCPLPSGYLVDQAFATARSTLSNPACRYKFDAVFASLLNVCKGAPDMKNKELLASFISPQKYFTLFGE